MKYIFSVIFNLITSTEIIKWKGGDLGKIIFYKNENNLKFEIEEIISWCQDLLNGLEYLCSQNVIHRDIKPEYI